MKSTYQFIERIFEKITAIITIILGNSIAFILALAMVLFWWSNDEFTSKGIHQTIGDIIFGTTFLSLFIIQKSFNRFSAILNLKINELITSHEPARNTVIHTENKTEKEISELVKEYGDLLETEEKLKQDIIAKQ